MTRIAVLPIALLTLLLLAPVADFINGEIAAQRIPGAFEK
jgi:hypothetical protein